MDRGSLHARLGAALGFLAERAHRRPRTTLLLVAALTAVAILGARRLRLDSDLVHLLPPSFESVQAVQELERRFWGLGYVAVVASGAEPEALRRFADEVAPELERLPAIRFVERRRPVEFFRDHALYYLDVEDLRTVRDRLEERRTYEVQKRSELFRGVLDEEDLEKPALDFSDLEAKYEERATERFGNGWRADEAGSADGYYLDTERRMVVLLAKPARRATDVGFVEEVVRQVQGYLDGLDRTRYGPGLEVGLSGRYPKKVEQGEQLIADLRLASAVAFALMLLYVGLHFRRPGAVVLVFAPLLVAVSWTFGFAGWVFGELNILTGFIGAIQLGLGIDHGVHLVGRYDYERGRGLEVAQALRQSFVGTGPAVVVAGLTTLVAFAGVGLSEYRAFHEFGVLAAVGMALVVCAYTFVLPALLGLRRSARKKAGGRAAAGRFGLAWRYSRVMPRWAPALFWTAAVLTTAALWHLPENRFDYDFASLEDSDLPAFRLDKVVNELLGHSQTPVVILTEDEASERAAVEAIRARPQARAGASSTVHFVASVADLVPENQQAKQPVIEEIGDILRRIRPAWLEPSQRERLDDLQRMTKAQPFGRADLPVELRRQFQGPGASSESGFVMVYPSVSLADGAAIRALARELRAVRLDDGKGLPLAGAEMVLADMLDLIERETPVVVGLTVGLVLVVMLLLLGKVRDGLLCFASAFATMAISFGLMPLVGVRLNYLNVVLVPVLFGIAIDGAVHLSSRLRESGDVAEAVAETGRSIAGSLLTTSFGFGAFLLANHPGLRSLGKLALLGLAVNLLVCLVLLPGLLALDRRWVAAGSGAAVAQGGPTGLAALVATVGKAGYAPVAPGTVGALVAVPLGWVLAQQDTAIRAAVVALGVAVSLPVVARFIRQRGEADPREVVLDELVGCLVAMAFVPAHPGWLAAAFVLFRLFDIVKPWPVGWIERRAPGAWGVVGDDVAAGLLAGGVLLAAQAVLG